MIEPVDQEMNTIIVDTWDDEENREDISRDTKWKPGQSGNPKGRPKGQTLKEYAREYYVSMTPEEKREYMDRVEAKRPGFAWVMAEGNPTEDKTVTLKVPTPILGGISNAYTVLDEGKTEAQKAIEGEIQEEIVGSTSYTGSGRLYNEEVGHQGTESVAQDTL